MRKNDRNRKPHLQTLMDLDGGHETLLKPLDKKH